MVEPVYTIVQKYMREYLNFEITICDKLAIYGLSSLSQDDCDKLYCYLWIAQLVTNFIAIYGLPSLSQDNYERFKGNGR